MKKKTEKMYLVEFAEIPLMDPTCGGSTVWYMTADDHDSWLDAERKAERKAEARAIAELILGDEDAKV